MKLELNDLVAVLAIFDLAASRGAFKANELAEIGAVFNKVQTLAQLVQRNAEIQSTPPDEELMPE